VVVVTVSHKPKHFYSSHVYKQDNLLVGPDKLRFLMCLIF